MSEEWNTYKKDTRTACKYGVNCYQRNPEHHKTYKHPPLQKKKVNDCNKKRFSPYSRETKQATVNANNDTGSNANNETGLNANNDTEPNANNDTEPNANNETEPNASASTENSNNNETVKNDIESQESSPCVNIPEDLTFYKQTTDHNIYKELFLVDMPKDFFKFYECLNEDQCPIEKTLASVNLELIGPYDLLLGKLPVLDDKELYLTHWRFFYDPPEFQAVIKKKGKSQFHIGYYRDEPDGQPVFMASNDSEKDYRITPVAENIFGAVYLYLQNEKPSPFSAMAYQKLIAKIKKVAEENNISLEKYDMKKRLGVLKTRTLHGAGIVFPYNAKTALGYRKLAETDAKIKELFRKIQEAKAQSEKLKFLSELQPVITYATIAVDECDFGTGLEGGIALFCSGLKELNSSTLGILSSTYSLLNRQSFSKIIEAHMKYRRRGYDMSLLSLKAK